MLYGKHVYPICRILCLLSLIFLVGCNRVKVIIDIINEVILEDFDEEYAEEVTPVYGPDAWKKNEKSHADKEAEERERDEVLGLRERYDTIYLRDDTREAIYERKQFELADARLRDQLAQADTPMKKHLYSKHVAIIGNFNYGEDPTEYMGVLNEWVEEMPDSYVPYMIRGEYYTNYAWYFRGSGWSSEVTSKGWKGFQKSLDSAQKDLEKAHKMEPNDPEPLASMLTVARANGLGESAMRKYYKKTLKLNPHHYNVRATMLHFMQPRWGGSWRDLDEIVDDANEFSDDFPLLGMIEYEALGMMYDRGKKYEGRRDKAKMKRRWKKVYQRQVEQSPEDLLYWEHLSYFSMRDRDFKTATAAFEKVGDRYSGMSMWSELNIYNSWRAVSYAKYSSDPKIKGTPAEIDLLKQAFELDHTWPAVINAYIECAVRLKDTEMKDAFLTKEYSTIPEIYWKATSIEFDVLEAISLAIHSNIQGIYGTEQGFELLEKALALDPDNAVAHYYLAEYYDHQKDYEKERIHLTKAGEIAPDWETITHIFGWLNYHEKNYDEGIKYAKKFLAGPPSYYLSENKADALEIIELCKENKAKLAKAED